MFRILANANSLLYLVFQAIAILIVCSCYYDKPRLRQFATGTYLKIQNVYNIHYLRLRIRLY